MNNDRRSLLARVHIAKKEMRLGEENYRAMLSRITGADSASTATVQQLDQVLAEFKRLGWQPKHFRPASPHPHVRKVYALWTAMRPLLRNPSPDGLRAFVRRQTKSMKTPNGVAAPEWLSGAQANVVIEALKQWQARLQAGEADTSEQEASHAD